MFPKTAERVVKHSPEKVNKTIERKMEINVAHYAALGSEAIEKRLEELDREWDMERALETNASAVALLGVLLGMKHRVFLLLPAAVTGFLLQHALQGWCPPVPLFRRLGVRTESEIAREKYALKALRGDFNSLAREHNGTEQDRVLKAIEAVER